MIEFEALRLIESHMQQFYKSLCDFGINTPDIPESDKIYVKRSENIFLGEQLNYDIEALTLQYERSYALMNTEQRVVFDEVADCILGKSPSGLFFLDAPAGIGKSFTLKALLDFSRSYEYISLAMASTALAALDYPGGATAHRSMKVRD